MTRVLSLRGRPAPAGTLCPVPSPALHGDGTAPIASRTQGAGDPIPAGPGESSFTMNTQQRTYAHRGVDGLAQIGPTR